MSCSPFDLKDYFFGELAEPARGQVEAHLSGCGVCREELSGLDLTRAALLAVPDEEPPRRIAFVSDKLFEPRWWQRLWNSGPQLGFASAAMLTFAILAHGYLARPVLPTPVEISTAAVEERLKAEVARAVAASEDRQIARTMQLVNTRLRDAKAEQRETLLMISDVLERMEKKNSMVRRTMFYDQQ